MLYHLRSLLVIGMCVLASLMAGCALPRMIDSDVQSFVGSSAPQLPADFRFERLPSQNNQPLVQTLELATQAALEGHGMQRNDAGARYLATVVLTVEPARNPHQQHSQPRLVFGPYGWTYAQPHFMDLEPPWFRHRLQLTLRDSRTGQWAYETSAVFDGPWRDSANLIAPMLEAALAHFPTASQGTITVELPAPHLEPH